MKSSYISRVSSSVSATHLRILFVFHTFKYLYQQCRFLLRLRRRNIPLPTYQIQTILFSNFHFHFHGGQNQAFPFLFGFLLSVFRFPQCPESTNLYCSITPSRSIQIFLHLQASLASFFPRQSRFFSFLFPFTLLLPFRHGRICSSFVKARITDFTTVA